MSKFVPIGERPLAFIDTETTGLDPSVHEVIEFAVIVEYPDGSTDQYHTLIKPTHIETAQPKALEINGYAAHPERWDDAPEFEQVAETICEWLLGCVIVGHNAGFDLAFLAAEMGRSPFQGRLPYHKVDTTSLAFEHLVPKGLTSLSLDKIRAFLGWSTDGAHTAMKDTEDMRRLYHILTSSRDSNQNYEDADLYQENTNDTAMYPGAHTPQGLVYGALGLVGEVGEVIGSLEPQFLSNTPDDSCLDAVLSVLHCATDLGEIAECLKKAIRDNHGTLDGDRLKRAQGGLYGLQTSIDALNADLSAKTVDLDVPTVSLEGLDLGGYRAELGDVCWYMARLHEDLGFDMSDTFEENIEKLNRRKSSNTIQGDGSSR